MRVTFQFWGDRIHTLQIGFYVDKGEFQVRVKN